MASIEVRQEIGEADATVNVVFVIEEGPRQIVSEIAISGLTSVDEDVVSRSLRLNVGDHLRTADWLDARRRLFESGLFRRVDIVVEPLGTAVKARPSECESTLKSGPRSDSGMDLRWPKSVRKRMSTDANSSLASPLT